MIDSVDVMKSFERIIQPNIKFLGIVIVIFILAMKHLDTNVLTIIFIMVFVFINHKEIQNTFTEIKDGERKIERVIEDNHRMKREIHFSEDLNKYLHKLRKYRKYNPHSYDEGYRYIKMYMYIIHDLEKDDIAHPRHYFENAQMYLKKSLNYFQSITISVPEEKYIHSLKYNKFEQTKLSNRIGKLCKKLHQHCYYLLYNLSLRFNEDFFEKPDIYKTEINLNADHVEESNTFTEKWELY